MNDNDAKTKDRRRSRGLQIAKTARIIKTEEGWQVPSQNGKKDYLVTSNGKWMSCTCPDYRTNGHKCKHIWAVNFIETNEVTPIQINDVKTLTIEEKKLKKKTYKQDWKSYNKATVEQKPNFMKYLKDVTNQFVIPDQNGRRGRPIYPLDEMIFSSIMRTFSTFSLRRFMGELEVAREKRYVVINPSYTTIGKFLQNDEITSILLKIIKITSSPLRNVESIFAADSTGFGTSCFQRWYSFKHGKEIELKHWVKCHFITGIKTNIITGVKITSEFEGDSPQLPELIRQTASMFKITEILGDKAYLSKNNLNLINETGAVSRIPFKVNIKPSGNGSTWSKAHHYFTFHQEEFYEHYYKRNNAETTVHMVKSKFGDFVRSRTWTAQVNEVLCKIICHNICVIIQEMHERGIEPDFKFDFDK